MLGTAAVPDHRSRFDTMFTCPKKDGFLSLLILLASVLPSGCDQPAALHSDIAASRDWSERTRASQGRVVRMAMWDGDPQINQWMRLQVRPWLKEHFKIDLQFSGVRGHALVTRMLSDIEADRSSGDFDIVWINGETFYQLRQINALAGPFTHLLPNARFIDWQDPFIALDFQQPVEGFECPWGTVQMTLIHNSETVPDPPHTLQELESWIRMNPGRFTFDCSFTGMTFLKSLLPGFAERKTDPVLSPDAQTWKTVSGRLWDWIRRQRPYLWREGRTFPEDVAQLHHLFSTAEVDFTMSNNDGEVDNKVAQGILPDSARAYVPDWGTIRNTHYLGIPMNAPQKDAAMIVINYLISPDAQLQKLTPAVWGDGTVLDPDLLSAEWRQRFESVAGRIRVPPAAQLRERALMEPTAEVMIRLHEGFREQILEASD